MKKKSQYIRDIYYAWNQTGAITHRKLTPKIQRAISGALGEEFSCEEIIEAINNYDEVLKSSETYWTYRWTLKDFLSRGLEKFLTSSQPMKNFAKNKHEKDEPNPNQQLLIPMDEDERKRRLRLLVGADPQERARLKQEWQNELRGQRHEQR